jgi:hypothetical protein
MFISCVCKCSAIFSVQRAQTFYDAALLALAFSHDMCNQVGLLAP